MRVRLRSALVQAMKARDAIAVSALRSALAAIGNAEAVDVDETPSGRSPVAGSVSGLLAAEVERRILTEAQVDEIVRAEVDERLGAAREYECRGRREQAERLRGEAGVLARHLPGATT